MVVMQSPLVCVTFVWSIGGGQLPFLLLLFLLGCEVLYTFSKRSFFVVSLCSLHSFSI